MAQVLHHCAVGEGGFLLPAAQRLRGGSFGSMLFLLCVCVTHRFIFLITGDCPHFIADLSFCRGLAPTGPVPAGGPPAQKPITRRVRHSFLLYKSVSRHPQSRLSIRCFRVAGTGLVFVLPGTVPLWDCPHLIAGLFHSAGDCTAPLHPAIYHKVLNDPPAIIIFADFPLYAGCSGSSNPPIGSAPKQSDLTVLQGTVHADIA